MDINEEQSQAKVLIDDFASGSPNRFRLGAIHLIRGLLSPPYLFPELIWLLSALIVGNIALELLPQPAAYWIDPSTSNYYSFFGTPFRWGIWNIVFLLGYLLILILILNLINIKAASPIWIGLCFYHFGVITESFRCVSPFYLPFETAANCSTVHSIVILVAGILSGIVIWFAIKLGLIPFFQDEASISPSMAGWLDKMKFVSIGLIGLSTLSVISAVLFAPKPVWKPIETAHIPTGRTEASLGYDTERSVAVLFGGTSNWTQTNGWNSINDTWEWDGKDWKELHPVHSPSPRYAASMAFDEKRGVSVLFGGLQPDPTGQSIFYDDTWEWDGKDWLQLAPSQRPPARQDASMFFDPARGTTVVYGGYYLDANTQTAVFLDDAWEWDGKNWQELDFIERRRNSSSAAVYDPGRQHPLLMDVEGLWSLQDSGWVPLGFPHNAPGRWNAQLAFNATSQQVVLFGGFKDKDVFDDTWLLNDEGWEQLIVKVKPPRRNGHNMFYDLTRGTVVLFGGVDGGTFYSDTWELVMP